MNEETELCITSPSVTVILLQRPGFIPIPDQPLYEFIRHVWYRWRNWPAGL